MKIIRDLLVRIVEEIDAGNSNFTEDELLIATKVLQELARKDMPMSKYEACKYLNISRATFDIHIERHVPFKGKNRRFKTLS